MKRYLRVTAKIEKKVQGSQLDKLIVSEDSVLIEVSSLVSDLEALERLVSDGFKEYAKARKGPAYSANFFLHVHEWIDHQNPKAWFSYSAFNPILPAKDAPIGYADAVSIVRDKCPAVLIKHDEDPNNYWFSITPSKALRLVKDVVSAWVKENT